MWLFLISCLPGWNIEWAEPDAWSIEGPGGPSASFDEAALLEHCAYLTGGPEDAEHHNLVVMHDGYLLMPWAPEDAGGGITFFDFSDPCDPVKVGEAYSETMRESHSMAFGTVGDREYLAVGYMAGEKTGGIGFWDVTDRSDPQWVSELAMEGFDYPDAYFFVTLSTFWQGDTLYVNYGLRGIGVVDVSDPMNPLVVDIIPEESLIAGSFHVVGNTAMASNAGASRTVMFDVSEPHDLKKIPGGTFDVEVDGDVQAYYFANVGGEYALFARKTTGGGPVLYDISDPANPTFVGADLNEDGAGGYAFRHGDLLFQGDSEFGTLHDISDPTLPTEVGRMQLKGDFDTLTPVGNVAVASVDEKGDPGQSSAVIPWDTQPDADPPQLRWHVPAHGEARVAETGRIGLSFDEMVERYSVHPGSVRVWTGDGQVHGRFNVQESIVNFTPDEPFLPDTMVYVEVPAGGVSDISGNAIEETMTFSFSTGAFEE
jgi:hypothetical protein